jgi:hypothetical protein
VNPFLVKNVVRTYDQHQETGRRIARFKMYMDRAGQGDSVSISRKPKDGSWLKRLRAKLWTTSSARTAPIRLSATSRTQLIQRIRQGLWCSDTHPTASGLQILKKTEQGVAELTNGEKDAVCADSGKSR